MEIPYAVETVSAVNRPDGEKWCRAVQHVVETLGSKFRGSERYFDGYIYEVGASSGYPYEHIRVVPSLDVPFFSLQRNYDKVLVTSYGWPSERSRPNGFQPELIINTVRGFAGALRIAVMNPDNLPPFSVKKFEG